MSLPPMDWLSGLHYVLNEAPSQQIDGYRNWGFTIYRTVYTPESEQKWQQLLENIQRNTLRDAEMTMATTQNDPEFQEVWSRFQLDPRSDPSLAGLDIDQLRQVYNSHEGGQPVNSDFPLHRIFLVADDESLSDPDGALIKGVDADYSAADAIPKNDRMGGQRYFGWMPMNSNSLASLWAQLDSRELSEIAPPTIGGSYLTVWSG